MMLAPQVLTPSSLLVLPNLIHTNISFEKILFLPEKEEPSTIYTTLDRNPFKFVTDKQKPFRQIEKKNRHWRLKVRQLKRTRHHNERTFRSKKTDHAHKSNKTLSINSSTTGYMEGIGKKKYLETNRIAPHISNSKESFRISNLIPQSEARLHFDPGLQSPVKNVGYSKNSSRHENSNFYSGDPSKPYILDRPAVKFTLMALFSLVFITGLVGNTIVLVVMYLHPRMKSTTNFFLTNLAVADLCVTVFCVLQNLSLYLAHSWVFGNFMCKMYSFVHHLSYTSSVLILVVNCLERYLAIMRPFKAKTWLRQTNLLISLAIVWLCSGIYCSPKLIFFKAVEHELENNEIEVICLADRKLYNSKIYDTINFFFLYLVPLTMISAFYFKIARYLWVNGSFVEARLQQDLNGAYSGRSPKITSTTSDQLSENRRCLRQVHKEQHEYENRPLNVRMSGSNSSSSRISFKSGRMVSVKRTNVAVNNDQPALRIGPYHSYILIRTWRKVVTLLISVVLCFAICNFPFHLRKMVSYYYGYEAMSDFALLATPITNLLTYLNSALNPLLYSFMSHNFRSCVKDVLCCHYDLRGRRRMSKNHFPPPRASNTIRMNQMGNNRPKSTKVEVATDV